MDQIAIIAAAGLRSRMEAVDMLSNNLANANTGGYKLDREFYSLFHSSEDEDEVESGSTPTLPYVQKQWTDFSQGEIQPSGNPLDLALNGKGFFAVNGPSGTMYTRNGAFKLSSTGLLITGDGHTVRGDGGKEIQATSQAAIEISPNGTIQQAGQVLGQLEIVNFANQNALNKVGGSYFRLGDSKEKPTPAVDVQVEQGRIEASNVVPAESAVRLVELMRQYEMLQKAVTIAADMDKKTTDQVASVNS